MASGAGDPSLAGAQPQLGVQLVGGPTAILEYGGLRWLTDPTLSPPGEYGGLTKLTGPALHIAEQDPIDVVLLSHHQHTDNLDPAGRAFLPSAKRVLSTTRAAEDLGGNVLGMEPWSESRAREPWRRPREGDRCARPARPGRQRRDPGPSARVPAIRPRCASDLRLGRQRLPGGRAHDREEDRGTRNRDPQRRRGAASEVRPRLPDPVRRSRRRCRPRSSEPGR